MRPHRLALSVAALAVALPLAAGCGGDDEPAAQDPSSTPSATLTGPGVDPTENFTTGDEFLQALATNTTASLAMAKDLVAPRSGAARYVTAAAATADEGERVLTEVSTGRYRLCLAQDCTVISDLVLSDGLISSFKVDGKATR